MKRSHTQAATKQRNIKGLEQKSKSLDIDKVMAKYEKGCNNEESQSQNQKSKLEILSSQKSKFHQIFNQKFKHEKFPCKMQKSPNYRTYYSREDSDISSGSFFGFSMQVMDTRNMVENHIFISQVSNSLQRMAISSRRNDVTPYFVMNNLVEMARKQVDNR